METMKFKTTIKCEGCIENVTPYLNKSVGADNWEVNTQTPEKILTVTQDTEVNETDVIAAVQQAGFKAERLHR